MSLFKKSEDLEILCKAYLENERKRKALDHEHELLKQDIIKALNGERSATCRGYKATFSQYQVNKIDTTLLRQQRPDIAAEYNRVSFQTRLTVS